MKNTLTVLLVLLTALLSACGPARMTAEQIAGTSVVMAQTIVAETAAAQPSATNTAAPPSATPESTATDTFTESPTPQPSETPTPTPTFDYRNPNQLFNYYIVPDENGEIGCSTNVAKVGIGVLPSGDPETDIRATLLSLFGPKDRIIFGLYNPLYGSNLTITGIEFKSGEWHVYTTGSLPRGEQSCTWDQMRVVINATIRNIPGDFSVEVNYNNHAMNDYLTSDR
jgi:hypothetical protein